MTLHELLSLQQISDTCYRGHNLPLGAGRVFGGQLIAQGLVAAGYTCVEHPAHSLHCNFLHAGDLESPIDYTVEYVRNGRSLATRKVSAWQNNRRIFLLTASFLAPDSHFDYQIKMPSVVGPDCLPELCRSGDSSAKQRPPKEVMRVDIRPVPNSIHYEEEPQIKHWWLRMMDCFPENILLQQAALAYCSDFGLLWTAAETHGFQFRGPGIFTASLDHSIWFHRNYSGMRWLLHSMECINTCSSRGLVRGQFFEQNGKLIASVMQEGLLRVAKT